VCFDNGVTQRMEWSKYAFFDNPKRQTAAKSSKLKRYNSVTDCPISFKFCTMTDTTEAWTMLIWVKNSTKDPPLAKTPTHQRPHSQMCPTSAHGTAHMPPLTITLCSPRGTPLAGQVHASHGLTSQSRFNCHCSSLLFILEADISTLAARIFAILVLFDQNLLQILASIQKSSRCAP